MNDFYLPHRVNNLSRYVRGEGLRGSLISFRVRTWFLVCVVCAAALGCGSVAVLQLGGISVTDPSGVVPGQLTSVAISAKVAIAVTVAKDQQNLGVNWTATCGGSPISPPAVNPCGTIAPAYVGNSINMIYTAPLYIPVGNAVTITASATSDPAVTSSIRLTIAPLPVTIAISSPPPASLGVLGTALISATVTNDTTAAGVNWTVSCGTGNTKCGSFQSGLPIATQTASGGQITYTAPSTIPSGGVVTITAASVTDSTKSASTTVTIAPISVTVTPTITVPLGTTANLVATVAYDSTNGGVDWLAPACGSTGACGSLSQIHTASGGTTVYTPPLNIPTGATVTVVAKSTANPSATASVVITVAPRPPIAVTVAPTIASTQVNGIANITAVVMNDQANLGADWTVTCGTPGACGSITAHTTSGGAAIYSAPSVAPTGSTATITAASTSDKTKSATATITIVPTISIAFTPALPSSVTAGTAASFIATVTNDVSSAGVDWTVNCSAAPCGSFSSGNASTPSHSASGASIAYTAPVGMPAGTVTITATSTASSAALPVRSVFATLNVIPVVAVNFVPYAPSQMQVSDANLLIPGTVNLVAGVVNDATNAGVDWSVCNSASACGQFQVTPFVAATSTTAAINPVYAATVHTASGQAAAYVPPVQPPSSGGTVTITAKALNPAATSSSATAMATIAIVGTPTGVPLQGVVLAGTHPVASASVSLYAAGTLGYNSAASPLIISGNSSTVTTGATGQFSIPAGYICPSQSSQMYLVAIGGNAGAGINPNLAMMTALGSCGGLNSAVNITIDEVTSVASVWALAPFMSDYGHVGSSSANANAGMANAFATVNNLANVVTGRALVVTPAGNGTPPRAEINTLANIVNTCTSTLGGAVGDGSNCGNLFSVTNPGLIAGTAPVNTLQALLNIAQTPSFNTFAGQGSIYNLVPSNGPFSPFLTTAPNDWTIAISYAGGGLGPRSAPAALAIDALGDVWITNQRFGSVTELNSLGAALSPTGTGTTQSTAGGYQGAGLSSPGNIAIDPLGNAWIANSNSVSELSATISSTYSGPLSGSGMTGGGLAGLVKGIAIDGPGNVWAVSGGFPGSVSWFAGANATINGVPTAIGTALSPSSGYTQGIHNPTGAIQVDAAGTVWVLNGGDRSAAEINSLDGSFIQTDFGYMQTVPVPINSVLASGVAPTITIDSGGNVFLSPGAQLVQLKAGGSSANAGGLGSASAANGNLFSQFLAVDGATHFWLMITGGSNFCASAYSVLELSSSGAPLNTNSIGCGYLGPGISASDVALAVDGSGSVWVLGNGTVTELVGVAAPVVAPFSLGVQNKSLGKRP